MIKVPEGHPSRRCEISQVKKRREAPHSKTLTRGRGLDHYGVGSFHCDDQTARRAVRHLLFF
jgi:hypothetical protein